MRNCRRRLKLACAIAKYGKATTAWVAKAVNGGSLKRFPKSLQR